MPTMDELIAARTRECTRILDFAKSQKRTHLSPAEDRELDRLMGERDSLLRAQEDDAVLDARLHQVQREPKTTGGNRPAYDRVARIGQQERTYHPGVDRTGRDFLLDISRAFIFNDPTSQERLQRHAAEERVERADYMTRAVGTGAFAGLTVPQYLTDLYAPATATLRPFADVCNRHDLPASGMTVNISRITTATGVALQATENTAVQNTDIDDTLLTENVQTAAGQQTVSRQAIERGTGIEDVTLGDLFNRYASALDSTLLNQATTGLSAVAQVTAYTDASPTTAEFWPKLQQAANGVEQALLNMGSPDLVVMHGRRWRWMQSQVGTAWPFMGSAQVPEQSGGLILPSTPGSGIRGILNSGEKIVVDNNIVTNVGAGTNEDEVYVIASRECHLWEDPNAPVFIRAEQPAVASLGVLLVVYGYFAYSFRRYTNAAGKIGGTGLITPVFA